MAEEQRRDRKASQKAAFDATYDDAGRGRRMAAREENGGGDSNGDMDGNEDGMGGKGKGKGRGGGGEEEEETYYDAVKREMAERAAKTKASDWG